MKWYWWYIWIVVGINAWLFRNSTSIEDLSRFLFTSMVNVVIFFLPVWLIVATVQHFRRPHVINKPTPKLEDNEPDDGVLPDMTRE